MPENEEQRGDPTLMDRTAAQAQIAGPKAATSP